MKLTARQWKKLVIWASAYINIIVFALVGGYFMINEQDKEVKKSVKYSVLVTIAFAAFSIFLNILSYIGYGLEWDFLITFCGHGNALMNFLRFIVYPFFAVGAVFFNKNASQEPVENKKQNDEIDIYKDEE